MKKSFVIYLDSLDILEDLTADQTKELLIAIRDYNLGLEVKLTGLMKAVFVPFKNSFDRDLAKYNAKCSKNSENALKRWNKKDANACERIKVDANHADSDNDNDNDSDSDNVNDSEKEINSSFKFDFFEKELKPFFNIPILSTTFNHEYLEFTQKINGNFDNFKNQFYDYKKFVEETKSHGYKKNFKNFLSEWDGTDWKVKLIEKSKEINKPVISNQIKAEEYELKKLDPNRNKF